MQNYHKFGGIISVYDVHDNLQGYQSQKDQIIYIYLNFNHLEEHIIYVDNKKDNYFINICLHLLIS